MAGADIAVYDHLRSTDPDNDTIYRVVGTDAESVTLLCVSDRSGRRANTGEVRTVAREELASFAPAENPDGNRGLVGTVRSALSGGYWSLRSTVRELVTNPIPSAVAVAAVIVGSVAGGPLPEAASIGLRFAGIFALAYIGSGRR